MTKQKAPRLTMRALARKLAREEEEQKRGNQARGLAREGRGGDTEIAHVTPGEIVIPRELQTPEVMAALDWAAAGAGLSLDRLRVGARGNSINPKTGAPEFNADQVTPMEEIVVKGKAIPAETGDRDLLARMIFAEAAGQHGVPGLYENLGWAAMNRIGKPSFPNSLSEVIHQRRNGIPEFESTTRPLWQAAADPNKLTGPNALAYKRAMDTATGILDGKIADPSGGAQFFFSGEPKEGGFFANRMIEGRLVPTETKYGPFTFLRDHGFKPRGN